MGPTAHRLVTTFSDQEPPRCESGQSRPRLPKRRRTRESRAAPARRDPAGRELGIGARAVPGGPVVQLRAIRRVSHRLMPSVGTATSFCAKGSGGGDTSVSRNLPTNLSGCHPTWISDDRAWSGARRQSMGHAGLPDRLRACLRCRFSTEPNLSPTTDTSLSSNEHEVDSTAPRHSPHSSSGRLGGGDDHPLHSGERGREPDQMKRG